jgi:hypothetical protein
VAHQNRGRIELRPLGTSHHTRIPVLLKSWTDGLKGWDLVAEIRRDGTDEEILIRHRLTGNYMALTATKALRSIDVRKVKAALAALGVADGPAA